MKKIPITDVINSWLKADARLEEQCKDDICEYDSNSAYKGYMLGFEDGALWALKQSKELLEKMRSELDTEYHES